MTSASGSAHKRSKVMEDPTLKWPNIRITSSSSIQTVVSTCLVHLANPSSEPLILHTLPSTSSSSSSKLAVVPKNSHAGLCKLISIVEIVKRELEPHQKEVWRREDEKEAKRLRRKELGKGRGKGKKRAREDDNDAVAEYMDVQDSDKTQRPATPAAVLPEAEAEAEAEVQGQTSAKASTESPSKSSEKKKAKSRPLLRVYQYNILDCFERLGGSSTSRDDEESDPGSSGSSSDSSEEEEEVDGDHEEAEGRSTVETSKPAAGILPDSDKVAAAQLDKAIRTHVIKAKKRPRKRHTPYMQIILSTTRLPAFENYYGARPSGSGIDNGDDQEEAKRRRRGYTLQLPAKKSRSRTKKKRRKHAVSSDTLEEGEVEQTVQLADKPLKADTSEGNVLIPIEIEIGEDTQEMQAEENPKSKVMTVADQPKVDVSNPPAVSSDAADAKFMPATEVSSSLEL